MYLLATSCVQKMQCTFHLLASEGLSTQCYCVTHHTDAGTASAADDSLERACPEAYGLKHNVAEKHCENGIGTQNNRELVLFLTVDAYQFSYVPAPRVSLVLSRVTDTSLLVQTPPHFRKAAKHQRMLTTVFLATKPARK